MGHHSEISAKLCNGLQDTINTMTSCMNQAHHTYIVKVHCLIRCPPCCMALFTPSLTVEFARHVGFFDDFHGTGIHYGVFIGTIHDKRVCIQNNLAIDQPNLRRMRPVYIQKSISSCPLQVLQDTYDS